jgi:hypothetical protein
MASLTDPAQPVITVQGDGWGCRWRHYIPSVKYDTSAVVTNRHPGTSATPSAWVDETMVD